MKAESLMRLSGVKSAWVMSGSSISWSPDGLWLQTLPEECEVGSL